MISVLIKREDLDTDVQTGRMSRDHEDRGHSDASTSHRTSNLASEHQKLGERHGIILPHSLGRT